MSIKRCSEGISLEDQRILRLLKITKSEFRNVLHLVFIWGCKKDPDESLEKYLTDKKGMTMTDYKNRFDNNMRKRIKTDPRGDSYDVSLLFACIKFGCDGLAQEASLWCEGKAELESLCSTIKNYRNRLIHEDCSMPDDAAMNTWCTNVTEILKKTQKLAGLRYGIPDYDVHVEIQEMEKQIQKIMKTPFGDINPIKLKEQMLELRKEQMNIVNEQGKLELCERYKHISKIDPASFVTGKERLQVQNVFTELEVICENKNEIFNETYNIEYNRLFRVSNEEGKEPTVIIVEGDAGAGKTTLTKLILSDWAEGSSVFEGLEHYDLVLYGEGKNKNILSYLELIQVLIPIASYKLADDDLLRSVLQLKVLLVMDGFDELNAGSEMLLKELSEKLILRSSGKLHLLITTRPSKLSDLLNILQHHSVVQTKLKGVSLNNRVTFVSKLHEEMIKEKQSIQETQKLIDLMKQSQSRLGEHYRLPLNLTLLTYLWASDPSQVNPETTSTGLYLAFLELIQSRLFVRLQDHMSLGVLPKDKFEDKMKNFLQELYSICLETLSSGFMQLSDQSVEALRKKCTELNLPFNDMTEAFLAVEKEWTSTGYKTDLTVPHKSIMEFYAANKFMTYIDNVKNDRPLLKCQLMSLLEDMNISEESRKKISTIIDEDANSDDTSPLQKVCQQLLKKDDNLEKYENMFLHLTGLLAHKCHDKLQIYTKELVEIMKHAGFHGTKWLDVLVEAKCDEDLARLLAPIYSGRLTVCDGHTGAAVALFQHLNTNTPVNIVLENEVSHIPHLDDMLMQLANRDCDVDFFLQHQWKHKKYGFSDKYLNYLIQENEEDEDHKCRVNRFTGHLSTLSHLPDSLTKLCITFADTHHAQKLLKELADLKEKDGIENLGVHVMPDVQPDGLSPLPVLKATKECVSLWLSKVADDWKVKCQVIHALLPPNGVFRSILFPQSGFTATQCQELIHELEQLGVKVRKKNGLRFSSSIIQKHELMKLKMLAKETLGCELYCQDELSIW